MGYIFNNNDRRSYRRLSCNIEALIFINNKKEIKCKVIDISEYGMCISVTKSEYLDTIDITSCDIKVQFLDSFFIGVQEISSIVMEKVNIRHIEDSDDSLHIGVYINSQEFRNYMIKRDLLLLLLSLFQVQNDKLE